MNRTPIVIAATILTGLVSLTACTGSGKSAPSSGSGIEQLTIASLPIKLLDTGGDYASPDTSIQWLGLESLERYTTDGKLEPSLASRVDHPNPTTYVYTLRSGVKFWDGSPLTSKDVVDSLERYMKPSSQLAQFYGSVKSVAASSDQKLTVTLRHADVRWPYISAFGTPVVESAFAAKHPKDLGASGVLNMGTGPFKFTGFVPNKEVDLVANPSWWGGKVKVQRLKISLLTDSSAIALALRAGSVDGYVSRGEDFSQFANIPGMKLTTKPGSTLFYLSMNTTTGPWSDLHVRRAVAHLINRDQIIKAATGGYASPVDTLLPKVSLESAVGSAAAGSFYRSYTTYSYDVTAAKREMAKSKYPHGFSDKWPIYPGSESSTVAQIVKQQLRQVNITLNVQQVPYPQWFDYYYGDRSKIGIVSLTYGGITYPSFYYSLMMDSANAKPQQSNSADYSNSLVDAYLSKAITATSVSQSVANLSKVAGAEATDLPYVVLYAESDGVILKNGYKFDNFSDFWPSTAWATHITRH